MGDQTDSNVLKQSDGGTMLQKKPSSMSKVKMKKKIKLFLMISPFIILVFCIYYIPLFGWIFAFTDYQPGRKLMDLNWIGFDSFMLVTKDGGGFFNAFKNTLVFSSLALICTPLPMFLAIMITQLRSMALRRVIQTITSFPNFISWVLVYSIVFLICSSSDSALNSLITYLGGQTYNMLGDKQNAYIVQTILGLYKTIGYTAIIYIASISGISSDYYEAAELDGASNFKKILHITIPLLMPTFLVMFLLQVGNLLNNGFEQFYIFQTSLTQSRLEVIDTYTYRMGIMLGNYSYSTAVSVMKSVISVMLLFMTNGLAKKIRGTSII